MFNVRSHREGSHRYGTKNTFEPIADEEDMSGRCESPVNQVLEAIPAELYVQDQQQWISLKKSSKMMSLPFCCR